MKTTTQSNRGTVAVYFALMLLLMLTYGVAHLDLGRLNMPVSLLIAAIKALLVAVFFMHLRYQKGVARAAAVAGIFWLGMLLTLAMSDYATRGWLLLPGTWP